jgi:hypothetical protein
MNQRNRGLILTLWAKVWKAVLRNQPVPRFLEKLVRPRRRRRQAGCRVRLPRVISKRAKRPATEHHPVSVRALATFSLTDNPQERLDIRVLQGTP